MLSIYNYHLKKLSLYLWIRYVDSILYRVVIAMIFMTIPVSYTHLHPLLQEQEAVKNNFAAKDGSYVITGSNMSGKTTFLRTIGMNMILLHAGAMVCAKTCSSAIVHVYTSMRVQDDVSEGISTFYAEILRIKEMMDASKTKRCV